ncbi:Cullin [Entamoeba marina]
MITSKQSVDELLDAINPFLEIVLSSKQAPLSSSVFASMNDLVYSFFTTHLWDTEGHISNMLQNIIKNFCSERIRDIKTVSDENLIKKLDNEI